MLITCICCLEYVVDWTSSMLIVYVLHVYVMFWMRTWMSYTLVKWWFKTSSMHLRTPGGGCASCVLRWVRNVTQNDKKKVHCKCPELWTSPRSIVGRPSTVVLLSTVPTEGGSIDQRFDRVWSTLWAFDRKSFDRLTVRRNILCFLNLWPKEPRLMFGRSKDHYRSTVIELRSTEGTSSTYYN